jgi:hypothetical protein
MLQILFEYRDRGVVMPDHLHLMITPKASLERAVQFIKGGSSHRIGKLRGMKSEVWQVAFHDWTIRDADDWRAKVQYIHESPVRAKLVEKAADWPYSSATERFSLDAALEKFHMLSSGAKAQEIDALTLGLKPQPPKEKAAGAVKAAKS